MIESLDLGLCDGCGVCLDVCPMDVFRCDDRTGKYRIVYRDDCMTCYVCEFECRPGAIYVGPLHRHKRHIFDRNGSPSP